MSETHRHVSGRRLSPRWLACWVALTACVATGLPLQAVPQSADTAIVRLLDRYRSTGTTGQLTFQSVEDLLRQIERHAPAWVTADGPGDEERRHHVVALLLLDVALAGDAEPSRDDFKLMDGGRRWLERAPADAFEAFWWRAVLARTQRLAFEMQVKPLPEGVALVKQAQRRFPDNPHFALAALKLRPEVVAMENRPGGRQDWLIRSVSDRFPSGRSGPGASNLQETLRMLTRLASTPEIGGEAWAHLGFIRFHLNELPEAREAFTQAQEFANDGFVRNLAGLGASLTLGAMGEADAATAALEEAVAAYPRAFGATVALAARLYETGDRARAEALVADAISAPVPTLDPWRTPGGDRRHLPELLATLKAMARVPSEIAQATPALASAETTTARPVPRVGAQAPETRTGVFRATTAVVSIDVAVTDRSRPVGGLGADAFALFDNGVAQGITQVSNATMPLDLTLVLDSKGQRFCSYSQGSASPCNRAQAPLEIEKRLIAELERIRGVLGRQDRLQVIGVGPSPRLLVPLQSALDDTRLRPADVRLDFWDGAYPSVVYGRRTALYDATAVALMRPTSPDRRHLVIVFTDGYDDASVLSPARLAQVAATGDALLVVVRRTSSGEAAALDRNPVMVELAGKTSLHPPDYTVVTRAAERMGGFEIFDPNGQSLSASAERLLDEYRQRYVLQYTPHGVSPDGWHEIKVSLTGDENYRVRHRHGYFGGL